ncbi:unnamed protein product, partial [Ectocarpus sp. 8 AP-2014]
PHRQISTNTNTCGFRNVQPEWVTQGPPNTTPQQQQCVELCSRGRIISTNAIIPPPSWCDNRQYFLGRPERAVEEQHLPAGACCGLRDLLLNSLMDTPPPRPQKTARSPVA